MQKAFDNILEGLLPEGKTALLAVSGGMDSICMADLFLGTLSSPSHIAISICAEMKATPTQHLCKTWPKATVSCSTRQTSTRKATPGSTR